MVIRVLIIAHERLIRQSLAMMLNQDPEFRIIGEAADGHEAFTLALEKKPHIILMEAELPKLSAANTIRLLLGCTTDTRILVLSSQQESPHISLALEAGAVGTVLTDVDHHELARIIGKLEGLVDKYGWLTVAPYPLMQNKIALTAWQRIEYLKDFDEKRISAFVEAYAGKRHPHNPADLPSENNQGGIVMPPNHPSVPGPEQVLPH